MWWAQSETELFFAYQTNCRQHDARHTRRAGLLSDLVNRSIHSLNPKEFNMTGRRSFVGNSLLVTAGVGIASTGTPVAAQASGLRAVVVRISRGSFDTALADEWERRMTASGDQLVPAIRRLKGLISYYAGIDKAAGSIINVSVWESMEAAKQMDGLVEMNAAAREFIGAGAKFERPIINYQTVWTI
jgi:quinol monooxygenase YgiN